MADSDWSAGVDLGSIPAGWTKQETPRWGQKDTALVCTVDTDASNLFILVSAKALNPSLEVSARVNEDSNVKKFERAGAIHVYSPFSLLGRRIARTITRPLSSGGGSTGRLWWRTLPIRPRLAIFWC